MPNDIPSGFRTLDAVDALIAGFSPVHVRRTADGGVQIGFRVGPQHCNPRGDCHGGTWATLADMLMGLNVGFLTGLGGPTVSMAIDFIGAGIVGQWVEGTARVLRHTPRLGFADCLFTTDGDPALRASAVYRRKYPPFRDFDALLAPGQGN